MLHKKKVLKTKIVFTNEIKNKYQYKVFYTLIKCLEIFKI